MYRMDCKQEACKECHIPFDNKLAYSLEQDGNYSVEDDIDCMVAIGLQSMPCSVEAKGQDGQGSVGLVRTGI